MEAALVAGRQPEAAAVAERSGGKGPLWALVGAMAVLLALLAGAVGLLAGRETKVQTASSSTPAIETTTSAPATTTSTTSSTLPPAPVLGGTPVLSPVSPAVPAAPVTPRGPTALDLLESQRAEDRSAVQALAGRWVTQLSSKKVGRQSNGQTFDTASILAHYQGLAARYPGVLLLKSDDYASFDNNGFWVVIHSQPHSSGAAALSFCYSHSIGYDDCFAKLLNSSSGKDTNVYQPR